MLLVGRTSAWAEPRLGLGCWLQMRLRIWADLTVSDGCGRSVKSHDLNDLMPLRRVKVSQGGLRQSIARFLRLSVKLTRLKLNAPWLCAFVVNPPGQGLINRKNRLPDVAETVAEFVPLARLTSFVLATQLVVVRSVFCSSRKVVPVSGQSNVKPSAAG